MKNIVDIEREATEQAKIIWPYPGEDKQRDLIKLGYMRAYTVMQTENKPAAIEVPFKENQFRS